MNRISLYYRVRENVKLIFTACGLSGCFTEKRTGKTVMKKESEKSSVTERAKIKQEARPNCMFNIAAVEKAHHGFHLVKFKRPESTSRPRMYRG
jgi:hypothetical protein